MGSPVLRRPPGVDVLVAAVLLVAALVEIWVARVATGPQGLDTVIALLSTVPLAWRRSNPWLAIGAASVACLLVVLMSPGSETGSLTIAVAWLIAVHGINAYRPVRDAIAGTALFLVSSSIMVIATAPVSVSAAPNSLPNLVFGWVVYIAAAAAGQVMAGQQRRLAAERVAAEARTRDEERRLIARELHDVVAHGVAVMVVQAGAAQELITNDPVKAHELLEAVQRTGQQSATELRRMLKLLGDTGSELGPQPGFADLTELVDRVRSTGLPISTHFHLPSRPVPEALQVTVYRVVQESLTNIVKHAPGSPTQVHIDSSAGHLAIDIVNSRVGPEQPGSDRDVKGKSGHGLVGMRERVQLYGGRIDAGPTAAGWRIAATLPLPTSPVVSTIPTGIPR